MIIYARFRIVRGRHAKNTLRGIWILQIMPRVLQLGKREQSTYILIARNRSRKSGRSSPRTGIIDPICDLEDRRACEAKESEDCILFFPICNSPIHGIICSYSGPIVDLIHLTEHARQVTYIRASTVP